MSFKRHSHYAIAVLILLSLSVSVQAKPVTLAVQHIEINAAEKRAEACLVFNALLEGQNRTRLLSKLSLFIGKTKQKIRVQDLSLSLRYLCIQNLKHRQKYQLTFRGRAKTYKTSFTVPDRPQKLQFIASAQKFLPRHYTTLKKTDLQGMAHVLRSINVPEVHLTLYHVSNPAYYASAWQHFQGNNVSPSESLLFARDHGTQVFESDLLFSDTPNVQQTLVVPLFQENSLKAGLYYLAATPQSKEGAHPALFAGQWFLVSDLHVTAVHVKGGLQVYSFREMTTDVAKNRSVTVWDDDGDVLAQGYTDESGELFLPIDREGIDKAFIVSVQDLSGVDLFALTSNHIMDVSDLAVRAEVKTEKKIYYPGEAMSVNLYAQGQLGRPYQVSKSLLQLIRSDDVVYVEKIVAQTKDGLYQTVLTLPIVGRSGVWQLVWRGEDGAVLARKEIDIALDLAIDQVEIQHKTDQLDAVLVRVLNKEGKGLGYKKGWVSVQCKRPFFVHFPSYRFGIDHSKACREQQHISFLTDATGVATLNISNDTRWSKKLIVHAERSARIAQIVLPASRQAMYIGIRTYATGGIYPENNIAFFDIVSAWGRSHETLFYTIYEEGRRFKWFLETGKWAYKRMPQHRRVGGGSFKLVETAPHKIEWPVTTGTYLLEISNTDGVVLAQRHFEAGASVKDKEAELISYVLWPRQKDYPILLEQAAMVCVTVTDGAGVYTYQQYLKAGKRALKLPLRQIKGDRAAVRFDIIPDDGSEPYVVEKRLNFEPLPVRASVSAKEIIFDLPTGLTVFEGDHLSLPFGIYNKGQDGVYTFDVEVPSFVKLKKKISAKVKLINGTVKKLVLGLVFEKPLDAVLHFKVSDTKGRHWYYDLPVRVKSKVKQKWNVQKAQVKTGEAFDFEKRTSELYMGSLLSIPPVFDKLETLMMAVPQTPKEMFLWLHTVDLWRPTLGAMGLLSADGWLYLKQQALREILLGQREDGSFVAVGKGSIAQTAAALHALYLYGNGLYSFEEKRAMQWLQDRLKSAWFVDGERTGHAYAFYVLAQLGRQDVSVLRYFVQSNKDIRLSVEARAALVCAFTQLNDDQEASRWFEKISIEELKISMPALALLATYEKFTYLEDIEESVSPHYLEVIALFAQKKGSWRVLQGGASQKYYGVMPIMQTADSFENQTPHLLYVSKAKKVGNVSDELELAVKRRLYHADGMPVQNGEVLVSGVSYVMLLSGEAEDTLRIIVPGSSAFSYASLDGDKGELARKVFSWLPQDIALPTDVVQSEKSFSINVPTGIAWHAIFLMIPNYSGAFTMPPLQAMRDGVDVPLKQKSVKVKVF